MSEHALQIAVAQFLGWTLRPPFWWSAIDHGAGKMAPAAAGRRKARGVRPGIADFLVRGPKLPPLWIEMKIDTGRQSIPQKHFEIDMTSLGDDYALCRSVEAVRHVVACWREKRGIA